MEDITLERLQTEFDEVISQINDIVRRKDIAAAREVLRQVGELVSNDEHVPLDDVEGYDHILHKLLDNIHGVIEIAEIAPTDPRLQELIRQREQIDKRIEEIDAELEALRKTDGTIVIEASERNLLINRIQHQIVRLRKKSQESGLSQEEIERLTAQITELEGMHRDLLSIEYTLGEADTTEIEKQIKEKEKEIEDLQKKIAEIDENNGQRAPGGETSDGTGFSLEVIMMINQIRDLRIRIASDEADLEDFEENFPGADGMDVQENEAIRRDREEAQRELDEALARLKEANPEAFKLVEDLENAINQLANTEDPQERKRLEDEIARLKGLIKLEVDQNRGNDEQNQARIDELTKKIEQLEAEINSLTNESTNLQKFIDANETNEAEEIVIDELNEADGLPPIQEQAKKSIEEYEKKTGIKLDPSMYELLDRGASGNVERRNAFEDNVGTPYVLVINKKKVQDRLAEIKKQIDDKNKEKTDLEKERDDLQNGRGGGNGGNDGPSDEKKKLEEELAKKKKELEDLNKQKEALSKKRDKTKIELERESYIKILDIRIKYLRMKLETAKRRGRTKEVDKLTHEIETIEIQIRTIRAGRVDNSDRINELTKEKEEQLAKQKEIDEEIKKIKEEKEIAGDRLDLEEEAHKIGEKIFKTAEIRKELENRGYTRDDFLSFYEQGREKTRQRIIELTAETDKIEADMMKEMGEVLHDDETGIGLHEQLRTADEAERIKIYEKMRKNFISSGREQWLIDAGITSEITTKEAADALEVFWNSRLDQYKKALQASQLELEEHKQNLPVFDREIRRINEEKEVVQISQGDIDTLLESAKQEKDLRKKQLRATMYGDPEIEKEWNERIKRFVSHKKADGAEITYQDASGNPVTVKVDTIEDYPELQDDAYFLNLEDYKGYTEIVSLYEKKGLEAVKAVIDMSTPEFDEYHRLAETDQAAADQWLHAMMAEKKEYINTYHGFTNKHAVKAAVLRTAGSTLEQMLPVTGNLPLGTKLKNGLINTGRFMMIKVPKFSRQDSEGKTVSGPAEKLGGALTVATDLLVVGGLGFAAFTGGLAGLVPAGLYYGAKGIVTVANRVAGRHVQKKYSEEIKNNLPTLEKASSRDKEVARRAYYRDAERMSGIRSFFRAKLDKLPFFAGRAAETEEKILKRQAAAIDDTVDTRVDNIIIGAKENARIADENHKIRVERQKAELRSAGTYNDIVRDPDSVDKGQVVATVAQNALIGAENPTAKKWDVNPTSKVERKNKYIKDDVEYRKTSDLKEIKTHGGTATVASITEEQKHKAAKERQDAINAVSTIVVAGVLKGVINFLKGGLTREVEVPDPDGTKTEYQNVYGDRPVPNRTKQVPKTKKVTVEEVDNGKVMSDYSFTEKTRVDTYNAPFSEKPVPGGKDYDALAFRWDYKGKQHELSMAEKGSSFRIGRGGQVQYATDMRIENGTLVEQLKELSKSHPAHYQQMLREKGLEGSSFEEVAKAVNDGSIRMYVQTSKQEGWREYMDGLITTRTDVVPDGVEEVPLTVWDIVDVKKVTVPDPDAVKLVKKSILDPAVASSAAKDALKGLKEGLMAGAVGTVIDNVGNIGSPTQHMNEGTFDRRTEHLFISRKATEAVDAYNQLHGLGKYANGAKKEEPKKEEPREDEHDENPGDER